MIETPIVDSLLASFCLPPEPTVIEGMLEQPGTTITVLKYAKCEQADLPVGQTCMDETELSAFFAEKAKAVKFFYIHSFVDYDDVENPIKSIVRSTMNNYLKVDELIYERHYIARHELRDAYFHAKFMLIDEKVIHIRQVMGIMNFLE